MDWFVVIVGWGLIMALTFNLGRQLAKKPEWGPAPIARSEFVEADDVKPERLAEIERDNAARLALTRSQCSAHVYDECGTCQRCFAVREGAAHLWSRDPSTGYTICLRCPAWQKVADAGRDDAHQAFPFEAAVEQSQRAVAKAYAVGGPVFEPTKTLPTFSMPLCGGPRAGGTVILTSLAERIQLDGNTYMRVTDPDTQVCLGYVYVDPDPCGVVGHLHSWGSATCVRCGAYRWEGRP
jgi:hypothetical protein